MLNFFRKHQKFFFFVVTFFVVVSFSFFGTFKSYNSSSEVSAKVVGKAVDGSAVTDRELAALERMLTTDTEKGGLPNFLHGGYLEKVLLEPKIADNLVKEFFPMIQGDLDERLKRVQSHVPYAHPEAPFINSMEVWSTFAPKVKGAYQKLLLQKEATPETFALLEELYLEQKKYSGEFIRKMLQLQLKQYSWLREDPFLQQRNLDLFGFSSVKDWFGPKFIQLLSRCIVNGAAVAKEKGYRVSPKEARGDLLHNVITSAAKTYNQEISIKEASGYFFQEARLLGLEEKSAVDAWSKALLFRQLLDGVGEAVFHDPLLYDAFASFAASSAKIELYELPLELRLGSFYDLIKFQVYLEMTAPGSAKSLDLPEKLLSVEAVEKVCPELVEEKVHLEMRSINLEELAQAVSLRETWAWQGDATHWTALQHEFEELEGALATTPEARLEVLDGLEDALRVRIDQFSRMQMVKERGELLTEALAAAEPEKRWISFRSHGDVNLPIQGVKDPRALLARLKKEERIERFSEDGIHYYHLSVLEKGGAKQLLSFADAKNDEAFVKCVDHKLKEAYSKVRSKDPSKFQQKDGTWKPLSEVKETVGAYLFASVLREIEKVEKSDEKISFSFYSSRRFAPFMKMLQARLARGEDISAWIEAGEATPWKLERREVEVSRGNTRGLDAEKIFSLETGQWSQVETPENGALVFCKLLSRGEEGGSSVASLNEKGKALLSAEAKRIYFKELVDRISKKGVIELREEEE